MNAMGQVLPLDDYNRTLVANVHPPDWKNPSPAPSYNMVVLGGGTAGLITSSIAAGLGARVALVERHLLGGDCLNVGCVPSKTLIRAARAVADLRQIADYGVRVPDGTEIDFAAVMERMRRIRSEISGHDSARRYTDELAVDVFIGEGRFTGARTIEVDGAALRFARAVIATGARAVELPIPGLAAAGYLTNETLFSLTARPRRLAVIGAGPIGCEMAQTFQRLGSEVSIFEMTGHVLPREDADAAAIVQAAFVRDGVSLVLGAGVERIDAAAGGKRIVYRLNDESRSLEVDEILVGIGRAPNVEGLGLEAAGVRYDRNGVGVDDRLRTSNPRIYAAGDICMRTKFTHMADAAAKIVVRNALFFGRRKLSAVTVPWCTYTDPEIAHVGMYARDAEAAGIEIDTYTSPLSANDRARAEGDREGFVKVHVKKGTDRIVGATIVARHAGEMISEVTVAMAGGVGLGRLSDVVHPYPTQAEAIKATSGEYMRGRLTPLVARLFGAWLRFSR